MNFAWWIAVMMYDRKAYSDITETLQHSMHTYIVSTGASLAGRRVSISQAELCTVSLAVVVVVLHLFNVNHIIIQQHRRSSLTHTTHTHRNYRHVNTAGKRPYDIMPRNYSTPWLHRTKLQTSTFFCRKLEKYVSPVPTYYAAVRPTFDLLSWKLTQRLFRTWGTFKAMWIFLFLFVWQLGAHTKPTDRQTDRWARAITQPVRMAA